MAELIDSVAKVFSGLGPPANQFAEYLNFFKDIIEFFKNLMKNLFA
jgi:hypothetical protein